MAKAKDKYDFGDRLGKRLPARKYDEDAKDSQQVAANLGISLTTAKTRIAEALKARTIELVWKHKVSDAGTRISVPAYRPIEKEGKA